jgi:hypothetical protein
VGVLLSCLVLLLLAAGNVLLAAFFVLCVSMLLQPYY